MSGAVSATATALTAIAGTAITQSAQASKAQADANQANYLSQVARNNQTIAQRNAALALQQGDVDAQKQQLKTAQLEGRQRATLASQGGDVDSGSDLDLLGDTARAGYTDAATARSNAALKAYNYELEANDAQGTANDYGVQASNIMNALPSEQNDTLLGAASKRL
jgi:hypothetical protein